MTRFDITWCDQDELAVMETFLCVLLIRRDPPNKPESHAKRVAVAKARMAPARVNRFRVFPFGADA